MSDEDHDVLVESYRFCERTRNRLFLVNSVPSDFLPPRTRGSRASRGVARDDSSPVARRLPPGDAQGSTRCSNASSTAASPEYEPELGRDKQDLRADGDVAGRQAGTQRRRVSRRNLREDWFTVRNQALGCCRDPTSEPAPPRSGATSNAISHLPATPVPTIRTPSGTPVGRSPYTRASGRYRRARRDPRVVVEVAAHPELEGGRLSIALRGEHDIERPGFGAHPAGQEQQERRRHRRAEVAVGKALTDDSPRRCLLRSRGAHVNAATACSGPSIEGSIVTDPSATGGRPWAASVKMVRSGCDSDVSPSLTGQLDDEEDSVELDVLSGEPALGAAPSRGPCHGPLAFTNVSATCGSFAFSASARSWCELLLADRLVDPSGCRRRRWPRRHRSGSRSWSWRRRQSTVRCAGPR